jgi:hypothetical protein
VELDSGISIEFYPEYSFRIKDQPGEYYLPSEDGDAFVRLFLPIVAPGARRFSKDKEIP